MKYLIVLILIVVYVLFGNELGYSNTSALYTHITYIFQHASILHLIFNSLAFINMYTSLEKFLNRWFFLSMSFSCAVLASFGAIYDKPTVGMSGVIYAMCGLYIGITFLSPKIKIGDTFKYLLFMFCILVSLTISLFKENSNFFIHLVSLSLGFICSIPLSILSPK